MNKGKILILILSIINIIGGFLYNIYGRTGGSMIVSAIVIFVIASLANFIYTPIHAKKAGLSIPLWGALIFFFNGFAGLVYVFAIKPKN